MKIIRSFKSLFHKYGPLFNIGYYAFLCMYSIAYTFLGEGNLPALVVAPLFYQVLFLILVSIILLFISFREEKSSEGEILKKERVQFLLFLVFNLVIVFIFLVVINSLESTHRPSLFQFGDLIFLTISIFLVMFAPLLSTPPRARQQSLALKWWIELGKMIISWNTHLIYYFFSVYFLLLIVGPFAFILLVFYILPQMSFPIPIILNLDFALQPYAFFLGVIYGIFSVNSYRWYVFQGVIPALRSK
jgi:hypothetical protein